MYQKNKNVLVIITFIIVVLSFSCLAQPTLVWANKNNALTHFSFVNSITVDANGNSIITGGFVGTVDFDPGPGTFNLVSASVSRDIFVSKLDASGNFLWAVKVGDTYSDDNGTDITTDAAGNIYVTGVFAGVAVDFNPGVGVYNLNWNDGGAFILKLDPNGNFIWAGTQGGWWDTAPGPSIAVDPIGNIYTAGFFNFTGDFDPGPGVYNLIRNPAPYNYDSYVSKLDPNGNFIWAKSMNGTLDEEILDLKLDAAGNAFVTGYFKGTTDFDPGAGMFNMTAVADEDIFVSKLDSSGNFVWAKQFGGSIMDKGLSIALDPNANVYTTGFFNSSNVDFNPGAGTFTMSSAGSSDIFVSKLDSSGNFVWAKQIGNTGSDIGYGIDTDPSSNVYIAGKYSGVVDFNPSTTGTYNLNGPSYGPGGFISKLNTNGNFVCAGSIDDFFGNVVSISYNNSGHVHITGDHTSTGDFDMGAGTYTLTTTTQLSNFVGKYEACICPAAVTTITTSASPTLCVGGSVVLEAGSGFSSYEWLPGGATTQTISVNTSGNYSVVVTNYCSNTATSSAVSVTVIPTPTVSIASVSSPTMCSGNNTIITPSGASAYTLNPGALTGTSFTVSPTANITYSITGTASNANCISSNTITTLVTVNTTPTVSISSVSNPTICSGNTTVITPSGAGTYTLNPGALTGTSFSVSPTANITYSITGTSNANCISSNTVTTFVTVNTTPTVGISSVSNSTICSGSTAVITPSGAGTYTLNPGALTGNSFTVAPNANTTYSITGTSNANCISSNTVTTFITVNTTPTVGIASISNPEICSGNNSVITPSGADTYTLNPGSLTGANFTVSPSATTNYTLSGTSNANCISSNTVTTTIFVNPTPTLGLTSTNISLCSGNTLVLPTASGGVAYNWSGPNTFTSSSAAPTVTNNIAVIHAGTYSVSTLLTYGSQTCTSTIGQVTVSVVSSAVITASNSTICNGSSTIITPQGGNTYTLTNTGVISPGSFTLNPTSTTVYTLSGSAGSGCDGLSNFTITVLSVPSITASAVSASVCSGNTATLTATGANTYTWNPTALTGSTVNPMPMGATTIYTVTGADINNCMNTTTVAITTNATPTIGIASVSNPIICSGNTTIITPSGAGTYTLNPGLITGTSFTVAPNANTTYSLTGISSSNCLSANTITTEIVVNSTPTVGIASVSSLTICDGNSTVITPSGANSYTMNPGLLTGTTFTVNPSINTTYTLTGITSANCISANTVTTDITVNPTPTVSIASVSNPIICDGNSTIITPSGAGTYTINPGGLTGTSFTVSPNASTTYSLTGISSSNCLSANTITTAIVVNQTPTVGIFSVSSSTICDGNSTVITPSGANSYTMNPGLLTGTIFTVNPSVNTTYTLTGITSANCISANTVTTDITVNPNPTVSIASVSTPIICDGNSTIITPSGANTYVLNPGALTGTTFTVSPNANTTFTLTGISNANCISANTITTSIVVNPNPTVSIASVSSSTICSGNTTIITPGGAATYTMNPGLITGTSFTMNPATNTTYSIVGTSSVGCVGVNTTTTTITVNTSPTVAIASVSSSTICDGNSIIITPSGANTYTLIPGALTGTTFTVNPNSNTTYTVVGMNLPNCVSSNTITTSIVVNPTPTLSIASISSPTICDGGSSIITPSGASTYTLNPGLLTGSSFTVNPNTSTIYTITGTSTLNCVSANTVTTTILVNPTPTVSLSLLGNTSTLTCINSSIIITPTVTPSSNLSYTWTGSGLSGPINQSIITFTTPGSYSLSVTNTLTGCSAVQDASSIFTLYSNTAVPNMTLSPTTGNSIISCTNTAITYVTQLSPSTSTVSWSNGVTTPTINITAADIYTVLVTDPTNGCTTAGQFTVTGDTNPPQNVSAGANSTLPCGTNTLILNGSSSSQNVIYSWSGPSSTSILSGSTSANPVINGIGIYTLTVTNSTNNCVSTVTLSVNQPTLNADFTANPLEGFAPLPVSFTNQSTGATSYTWFFGDSLNTTSTETEPNHTYTSGGNYTVMLVASLDNCLDTAYITIVVQDELMLEIPNVFTPNNDGVNDVFYIKSKGVKEMNLEMYNRWGQKLFEYVGPKAAWDGIGTNGEKVPDGTYFYMLKALGFNGKEIQKNGSVNLFR